MERSIVNKLYESRNLGYYKGYHLEDSDGLVSVKKNGNVVVTCDSERDAYEYIDNLLHHENTKKSSPRWYIRIKYPDGRWYCVCEKGCRPERSVTSREIRFFSAKNKAEQAFKQISKNQTYTEYSIELYR